MVDEIALTEELTEAKRLRPPQERGQPVRLEIRGWLVLPARMAGWRKQEHQELLGDEVLWGACEQLQTMVPSLLLQEGPPDLSVKNRYVKDSSPRIGLRTPSGRQRNCRESAKLNGNGRVISSVSVQFRGSLPSLTHRA